MYSRIAIIGVGSVGGFLTQYFSDNNDVYELVIVDNDIVELDNVKNSIYTYNSIGEYKVDALKELLSGNTPITKLQKKYLEGQIELPRCDLVIDCRDYLYDRQGSIDARIFISGRQIVIDCKKYIHYSHCKKAGKYSLILSKAETRAAASLAGNVILSNIMSELIKNQTTYHINLDHPQDLARIQVTHQKENKIDYMCDQVEGLEKLYCLEENLDPIVDANTLYDLNIYLGPKHLSNKVKTIPKKSLLRGVDVIRELSVLVRPMNYNYIVCVKDDGQGQMCIELIKVTGAA